MKAEGKEGVDGGRRDVLCDGISNPAFRGKELSGGEAVAVTCGSWWC